MANLADLFGLFGSGLGVGVILSFFFAIFGIGISSLIRIFTAEDIDR